jgi:hypothetical protein
VEAGFEPDTVVERGYRESGVDEVGMLDNEGRAFQTLYVEARRPG